MKKPNTSLIAAIVFVLLFSLSSVVSGTSNASIIIASSGSISINENLGQSYIIHQSYGTNYIQNVSSGLDIYSSSNVVNTFSTAFSFVSTGGKITVFPGTYTATASVVMTGCSNINLVFEKGAVLTIGNHVNQNVLLLNYVLDSTFTNVTINGNKANQDTAWTTDGIYLWNCANVVFVGANITNVFRDGFATANSLPGPSGNSNNGIINSTVWNCDWNSITLGSGGFYTLNDYAINNDIAYSADVGISTYGINTMIRDNYIHDMNGTTDTRAQYGIATELDQVGSGSYAKIINNIIVRCLYGVVLGNDGTGNLIKNNFINCSSGIASSADNNVITQNTIVNVSSGGNAGIFLELNNNDIVSFNNITCSVGANQAIYLHISNNTFISNNTIVSPNVGVYLDSNVYNSIIENNAVIGITGVKISSSSDINNKISGNTFNCNTNVSNAGTGTIINPPFSDSYILIINDPSTDGLITPSVGIYNYHSTSKVSIVLTPPNDYYSALNIDGVNVTLADNTYSLEMNMDHIVYTVFQHQS